MELGRWSLAVIRALILVGAHIPSFEAGLGGLMPYGARRLKRLARAAKASGVDPTDYTLSYTARSFAPYYGQRLSASCVMNGARAIQKSLKAKVAGRRSVASVAA